MVAIKRLLPVFLFLFAGIVFIGSSCVRDGGTPCPNYLRIEYDYNMEFVDQLHTEVTFLSIFMFDARTGVLVREVKQTQNPFPEKYTIAVPEEWMDGRTYDLVVWAGLNADSYDFPTLTPGISTLDDFRLRVKGYEDRLVARTAELEPLWHGMLSGVAFDPREKKTHTVSLRKDTRKFRLVVQSLDENHLVEDTDFDIRLYSADGWYDGANSVLDPTDRAIEYCPYYTTTDPDAGAIAEMNSLRLLNDGRENFIRIADRVSGALVLEIPLMRYLNALRLLEHSSMPFQEYLDREDEYYILVFLQKTGGGDEGDWLAVQISINDWIIRLQDIEQ